MVFINAKPRKGSKSLTINLLKCISFSTKDRFIIHDNPLLCEIKHFWGCWTKSNFLAFLFNFREHLLNEVFFCFFHIPMFIFSLWSDKWKVEMTKNALSSSLFECRTILGETVLLSFHICQIKFLHLVSTVFSRKTWDRLIRTNLKLLFSTSNHHFRAFL